MKNTFPKFESSPLRFSVVGRSPPINPLVHMETVFFLKTFDSLCFPQNRFLMIFPSVRGEGHGVPFQARLNLGGNVALIHRWNFGSQGAALLDFFTPTVGVETWYLVEKNRKAQQIPACPLHLPSIHQKKSPAQGAFTIQTWADGSAVGSGKECSRGTMLWVWVVFWSCFFENRNLIYILKIQHTYSNSDWIYLVFLRKQWNCMCCFSRVKLISNLLAVRYAVCLETLEN